MNIKHYYYLCNYISYSYLYLSSRKILYHKCFESWSGNMEVSFTNKGNKNIR